MNDQNLVPVFVPALVAILINTEDKKGSTLTIEEVISIRDSASVIMMEMAHAEKMAESRGYHDVDPENCWYDWQMVRRELGRKPDLDAGAKMNFHIGGDAINFAIERAKSSLTEFRNHISKFGTNKVYPLVKMKLVDKSYNAFNWLLVKEARTDNFLAEIFELPSEFNAYKVGDILEVKDSDLSDWMINNGGVLYGGFTIRAQREAMTQSERARFDDHMGVQSYA